MLKVEREDKHEPITTFCRRCHRRRSDPNYFEPKTTILRWNMRKTIELDGVMMTVTVRGKNSQEAMKLVFEVIADRLGCIAPKVDRTSTIVSLTRKGR